MKKPFKLFFVSVLLFSALHASAHVLKTDGTIGAVLHVDPNDQPSAGSVSTFFFDLTDTSKRFAVADCLCTFTINAGGKEVFAQPVASLDPISYTFADPGVYTVTLAGAPRDGSGFQPFSLPYDIRVERGDAQPAETESTGFWGEHGLHFVLFGGAILVAGFIVARDYYKGYSAKSN